MTRPGEGATLFLVLTASVCPVLVGRQEELSLLLAALLNGGAVITAGEAGIGKSRLLREFASEAERKGFRTVWGRPEAVSDPGPYSLILDLLDNLAATSPAGSAEARELSEVLAAPAQGRSEPPARQIAARTRGLLTVLGPKRVILLEDLHMADEPSQAVVAHLARSARDDGTLLVGALRSDEESTPGTSRLLDVLQKDRLAQRIDLEPLKLSQLQEMLEAMWGEEPTPEELQGIATRGEGIPFFVEELAVSRVLASDVPESITLGVQARLQRLSPQAREVIVTASISAGALDPEVLAQACDTDSSLVPSALVEGISVGLLDDQSGRIAFRHGLLREAVASTLASVERRQLHARVATAIEAVRASELDRFSLVLAHHHELAGDGTSAATWLVTAGSRAVAAGTLEEAREYFEKAIQLGAGDSSIAGRATRGLAEARAREGKLAEAAEFLAASRVEWRRVGNQEALAEATAEEALLRSALGEVSALALSEEAVSLALAFPPLHARALHRKGAVIASLEPPQEAIPVLSDALEAAIAAGDVELEVRCELDLARLLTFSGDIESAAEHGERARRLAIEHRLDHLVGRASAAEASRLSHVGANRQAIERLDEAAGLLSEGLSSYLLADLNAVRAITSWRMGLPAEADRYAKRLESGRASVGYGRVIRAWAATQRGDDRWARSLLDSWWDDVGPQLRDLPVEDLRRLPESPEGGQFAQLGDAVVAAFCHQPDELDEDRARRYWLLCEDAFLETRIQAGWLLGLVLVRRGRVHDAREILTTLRRESITPTHLGFLAEIEAGCVARESDSAASVPYLVVAAEAYANIANSSDQARVLTNIAALSEATQAKALLRDAMALAELSGAKKYANMAEATARSKGIRPRAGRPKGSSRREGLSAREEEVVTLLATGATNAEIAGRLFLSERTVQDHIARAGKRLGVSGRAGLAAWAAKQGLI